MSIAYSKNFIKQAKKLSPDLQEKLYKSLQVFGKNPLDPALRNHALKGKYKEYRSINVSGDVRILYLQKDEAIIFDMVGTHSQLYC